MISASYRNYNSYSYSRNSPARRQSSRYSSSERAATSSNSNSGLSSSNAADFIYRGSNKHHWAKLQSKIKQRLMHDNISYIEDEVEIARRSMPPPPAEFLAPPAFLETAQTRRSFYDNRNSSTKTERENRTNTKPTRTTSQRTSRRASQHTSHFCKDPSLPT